MYIFVMLSPSCFLDMLLPGSFRPSAWMPSATAPPCRPQGGTPPFLDPVGSVS